MGRPSRGYKLRQLPGGTWQVRFSHAGKRYEPSTEEVDLDRAEAKARQIYAAVISGRWVPGSQLAAPGAAVWQVAAGWLDAIEPMVAKSTRRQYGIYVTAHWQPHFVELDAFARPPTIPAYIRKRLKQVRRRTLQKELSALRGFLAWCAELGHLPEKITVPPLMVKSPGTPDVRRKHKSVPIELSVTDVAAILGNLPEVSPGGPTGKPFAVRDFYRVCYETGLRPDATVGELVPEDLRAGELAVRDEVDKARFGRSVPLTPIARECLERHATRPGKPIFGRHHRSPYLKEAALLAGKPGVSAYDFRHARATHLMESSGNNIMGVGFLLGHTQATTTNRYAKQTHRAAVAVLGEAARPDDVHGQRGKGTVVPGPLPGDRETAHEADDREPLPRAAGERKAQLAMSPIAGAGPALSPNVLGTTGNGGVRKEGVEPSREVIPQEPEGFDVAIYEPNPEGLARFEATVNGAERQAPSGSWVSDLPIHHPPGCLCETCQRHRWYLRVLPAIGVTQEEIERDLAPRRVL